MAQEHDEHLGAPDSVEPKEETALTPTEAVAQMRLNVPTRANRNLRALLERANVDTELKTWWHVANVNAVRRLEINDHSWVHVQVVANIGLKLLRQLTKHKIEPSVVRDMRMTSDDAEVIVVLGAMLHDVGMAIHRQAHEDMSLFMALPKIRQLLERIYVEPEITVIAAEVLQAIISHRDSGQPLSLEAGIVRVADALDMAKGRSRIPFEHGRMSIHSLSAAAIESVSIGDGEDVPILIEIAMNNSSGIYQVDELLKAKLRSSGLEPYVEVVARIDSREEKRLVPLYVLEV
ncbi:MAG: HD domain-containing protein [Gaiellales bacterium]